MSRLTSTLMNAVPRLVLASPAHRLMSGRYATLHFAGRRTGRRYHLPVAYREPAATEPAATEPAEADGASSTSNPAASGGRLVISTDSGWWRNIASGTPFTVRLRGSTRLATARQLEGDDAITALADLVTVPGYTKAAGIPRNPDRDDLERAARGRVVLELHLDSDLNATS